MHWLFTRLARHDVSLLYPSASDGAHVGTVRAMMSPFLTGSVVTSGNCTLPPKYGCSSTAGLWAMSV